MSCVVRGLGAIQADTVSTASLTEEEIAAIDEAGAKGPSTLAVLRGANCGYALTRVLVMALQVSIGLSALLVLSHRYACA